MAECMAEGVRGKRDWVNAIYGGFAAGQVVGIASRSMPVAFGAGLGMAIIGATVEATGGLQSRTQSDWNKLLPSSYNKDGAEQ